MEVGQGLNAADGCTCDFRHPHGPSISRGTTEEEEAHFAQPRTPPNGDESLSRADLEHVHRFIGRPRAKARLVLP
jgi:hypothetical protein